MSLRDQAEELLAVAIESVAYFGQSVTLTNPAGFSSVLIGDYNDIGATIDPESGQVVSGRTASVALRISTLKTLGFADLPRRIADGATKPWRVGLTYDGEALQFIVRESLPDRSAGVVVLMLEEYTP